MTPQSAKIAIHTLRHNRHTNSTNHTITHCCIRTSNYGAADVCNTPLIHDDLEVWVVDLFWFCEVVFLELWFYYIYYSRRFRVSPACLWLCISLWNKMLMCVLDGACVINSRSDDRDMVCGTCLFFTYTRHIPCRVRRASHNVRIQLEIMNE